MREVALLALLVAAGCGSPAPGARADRQPLDEPDETGGGDRAVPPDDDQRAERPPSARLLSSGATFSDLVGAARRQDELRDQDSDAGCLLRRGPAPRLEADLAAAVRPLPEVPPTLSSRLAGVAVLTRYGALGSVDAPLGLVAFTTTRPAASRARVLVVTRGGLFRGATDAPRFEPIERSALATIDDGTSHVFVTAEAAVTVEALAEVLAALPTTLAGRVGLAVALPESTRLPARAAAEGPDSVPLCELSPLPDEAWGELETPAIREGVAPLLERARLCAGTTDGAGALGGRVVVSMRIGPDGRVVEACVTEDETDDGVLRACLVAGARELVIGPPRGGSIDVALPIRIEPGVAHRQVALCPGP